MTSSLKLFNEEGGGNPLSDLATTKNLQELGYLSRVSIQISSTDFFGIGLRKPAGSQSSAQLSIANIGACTVLSKVLLSFTRYFVDVLESSCTWRYALQDDRRRLTKTVTETFDRILRYVYGIDSKLKSTADSDSKPMDSVLLKSITDVQTKLDATKKPKPTVMAALLPAASHLVDSFLPASSAALR